MKKRFTEKELLEGLDAESANADKMAKLLPKEFEPLRKTKGSVTDPEWDEFFDSDEGVSDDFMEDRGQPSSGHY